MNTSPPHPARTGRCFAAPYFDKLTGLIVNGPGSLVLLSPMMYDNLPSATHPVLPTCVTDTGSAKPPWMVSIWASSPLDRDLVEPARALDQQQAVAEGAPRVRMVERARRL
jgi:hypothetical protein